MQSSVRSWRWEYWRWRWPVSILQDQPTEPQNFPVSPRGSEAGTAGPRPQSNRPVRRHMLALDQQQTAPSADRRADATEQNIGRMQQATRATLADTTGTREQFRPASWTCQPGRWQADRR